MQRRHLVIQALGVAFLIAPGSIRAQNAEETSVWQFGVREVDWEAIEQLRDEVREYREAGAIGPYEFRIHPNGARFDAMITAEIVDAALLAGLRDLDSGGRQEAASETPRGKRPS